MTSSGIRLECSWESAWCSAEGFCEVFTRGGLGRPYILAIAWPMEYSQGTAFLNLLPDSRLRQARHASAFIKAPAPRGVGDGRTQTLHA